MKLHHVGFVVSDINSFEKHMLFEARIGDVTDPLQKARLALYKNYGDAFIELIQPLDKESFTYNFLSKNGSVFHHICYEAADQAQVEQIVKEKKLIKVLDWVPAVLFSGRKVSFYYSRNKNIIEFLL